MQRDTGALNLPLVHYNTLSNYKPETYKYIYSNEELFRLQKRIGY